jgi:recombination protein RecR
MHYPAHLQKLIEVLKQLPGVGAKSAERYAFQMLSWSESQLSEMGRTISQVRHNIKSCEVCGCLTEATHCLFCTSSNRSPHLICIIASPRDAFAIDRTNEYRGHYHVLGGLLSPLDGQGPEALELEKLVHRIEQQQVTEVVIALDATLEGDATALFLKQILQPFQIEVSRLAFGLPMGSSLDYVDGDTLGRAFSGRRHF